MRDGVGTGENDGNWEVVSSTELGVGLGVNMLIDSDSSDVDIGLRRPSELTVAVGDTGIDAIVELATNEDVKIGMKIELESGGKELSVKTLMDRDNSEVGKGIRTFVVLTGVVGTTVVKISPISEVTVKSIAGDVVKGRGLRISEDPMENKNVSVGTTSMELSSDGEAIDEVSTWIVDAILKDGLEVEGVGVITIIAAVVSSIGIRLTILLLIPRDELSGSTESGLLALLLALTDGLCCMGLLLTRMKGRSATLLLIVRNGICVCGSIASIDEKTRDDDNDADDTTLAGIGKLLGCGGAGLSLVLSGTIELLGSDIGIRIASPATMEVGAMKEILSMEGGKSAPEPIPDPMVSVGIGRPLVVISLVSLAEVKEIAVEICIDLLG